MSQLKALETPPYRNTQEYLEYRPDLESLTRGAVSVGSAPIEVPFPKVMYQGSTFYRIEGALWEHFETGSDKDGIFVVFFRTIIK